MFLITLPQMTATMKVLLLCVSLWKIGCIAADPCRIEIAAYDFAGNRLHSFRLIRVAPREAPEINLLTAVPRKIRVSKQVEVAINSELLGQVVLITVQYERKKELVQPVFLMKCSQRVSLRLGANLGPEDVTFDRIRGSLTGCSFTGDWWVRAFSMFGQYIPPGALEAKVNKDGTFEITGPMDGERHIIVIGKAKNPVKAIGANIIAYGPVNDIGTIDLSGACPP